MNKDCVELRQHGTYLFNSLRHSPCCTVDTAYCSRLCGLGVLHSKLSTLVMIDSGCAAGRHCHSGCRRKLSVHSTKLEKDLTQPTSIALSTVFSLH